METIPIIAISVASAIATLVLVSCGLAVIFGLMCVVNMAHGQFLMIGAMTTTVLVTHWNVPIVLAIAASPIVGGTIGILVELLLIRRVYARQAVETLLVTFGIGLVMYQMAVDIFGTTPPGIQTPLGPMMVGGYSFPVYSLVQIAAAFIMLGVVYLIFTRTRYGLLARATAENPDMAQAMGVAAKRVNMVTFAFGCALAALGGALLAPMVSVSPDMGDAYVGQAFMTVVVAGPAFILGTLLSSALLGGVSNILAQALTNLWGVTGLFFVAVVLLRVKPMGISGSWRRQL